MLHIRTKLSALNYSIFIFVCYLLSLMLLLICINSVSLHLLILVYCSRLLFWGEALELACMAVVAVVLWIYSKETCSWSI